MLYLVYSGLHRDAYYRVSQHECFVKMSEKIPTTALPVPPVKSERITLVIRPDGD